MGVAAGASAGSGIVARLALTLSQCGVDVDPGTLPGQIDPGNLPNVMTNPTTTATTTAATATALMEEGFSCVAGAVVVGSLRAGGSED